MGRLLDFALRKLIGVKGVLPGMKILKRMTAPSLIDIAPAVWDLQYLQARTHAHTMSAHAQVIPTIAAGIARLRNARSASLREKLDNLLGKANADAGDSQDSVDAEADVTDEFKKRLWSLCQTRIRPVPTRGNQVRKETDGNTTKQPPAQIMPEGEGLVQHTTPPYYPHGFSSNVVIEEESYELVTDYDTYTIPGTFSEPNFPEPDDFPHTGESYSADDGEQSSEEDTHGSEGDYFYADGQGNIFPIERHAVRGPGEVGWPIIPPVTEPEGFTREDEETAMPWDESPNEQYIMYHEVEHWPPVRGALMLPEAAEPPLLLSQFDDTPFDGWGTD
ncbi:hypothetical protein C8A03DRAFT_12617 [Achaetomium macrosporum]|uniref:Uncharacterized protein n=1 Tax=Achaetomium macrosporum TaxID=79813 RepID=A0AAN7CG85_9PEZI|nr:hypothetical protein C8A03DRAFT_12617 [Achaetomium macrosporum]